MSDDFREGENIGKYVDMVVDHSEMSQQLKIHDGPGFVPSPKMDAKELHLHYSVAQLELALLRGRSRQIGQRIADLQAEAVKLRNELDTKERS